MESLSLKLPLRVTPGNGEFKGLNYSLDLQTGNGEFKGLNYSLDLQTGNGEFKGFNFPLWRFSGSTPTFKGKTGLWFDTNPYKPVNKFGLRVNLHPLTIVKTPVSLSCIWRHNYLIKTAFFNTFTYIYN